MIKILTDSTSYMPKDFADEHDITVIPLRVTFEDMDFDEGFPGSYDAFFEKLASSKEFPKTAQPSITAFVEAFDKVIDEGNEGILFTLSANLSGTYSAACVAREQCKNPEKITVLDSGVGCQTTWGLIMEALEKIDAGASRDEVLAHIATLQEHSAIAFVPDSLEYLKRGGRISRITATLGTLLQIKPVLALQKGVLGLKKNVLGTSRAVTALVDMIPSNIKKLFVLHILNTKYFDDLKAKIKAKFKDVQIWEGEVGPVFSTHVGPAVGVAWIC